MSDEPLWKGRPVSELSIDDLRSAFRDLLAHLAFEREMHDRAMKAWKAARDARRERA